MSDQTSACEHCAERSGGAFEHAITMAFQPIVDVGTRTIWAQEALVRGADGASAAQVLARVGERTRYNFDQTCRRRAIELAARLGIDVNLSINFMPNAVYDPANCIRATLAAADRYDFPIQNIIFELTEKEAVDDLDHLKRILSEYQRRGFRTALDDFGAGYAGLGVLADVQPDIIKIDRSLVSRVDGDGRRQAIVEGIVRTARTLGVEIVAEGIERAAEAETLQGLGVALMQGYFFARPAFEAAPGEDAVTWPDRAASAGRRSAREVQPTAASKAVR